MGVTLGCLFSGSGTWERAAEEHGIEAVWTSEIEPFPIAVTKKNLPNMKHLGDVSKINGADIEPVDVIAFSSPCQNLSVAGNRSGLAGSESGLFFEAVRIIKEMRDATSGKFPRYAIWENVEGAFFSNKGEDFRTVLKKLCGGGSASEPFIPKPDKWDKKGCIMGDNYSVAWRLLNAQFWGVPQRRKRVFVVTDFNGYSAGEILFNEENLRENLEPCEREETGHSRVLGTVSGKTDSEAGLKKDVHFIDNHPSGCRFNETDVVPTLTTRMGTGGNQTPLVVEHIYTASKQDFFTRFKEDVAFPLSASDCKDPQIVYYGDDDDYTIRKFTPVECARVMGFPDDWAKISDREPLTDDEINEWIEIFQEWNRCIGKEVKAKTPNQIRKWFFDLNKDSAQYKMWGNGIAYPCADYIIGNLACLYK